MRRFSLRRMLAVARKELLHLLRDHRMRPVVFIMPVIQLIVLGLAANLDVQDVRLLVVDHDQTPVSREIIARSDASSAFDVVSVTMDERDGEAAFASGAAELVLVVPKGTQRSLARGDAFSLPVWVDGTDTNRGLTAKGFLDTILASVSADNLPKSTRVLPLPGLPELRVRVLYNPTLQSRWFMVPAVVVMVLSVITTLLAAMAVVKERENGTIEQLVVTPIRPVELILGKLLPFVGIGFIIATLVVVAAVGVFGVPFRGSILTLYVGVGLFLLSTLGIGLLASTISQTQQQAMLSAMLILLPSFLLGGIFYPVSNMPPWAQHVANVTPIRYFVVMVRAIFLKGSDLSLLAMEARMLLLIGVVVFVVAVSRFQKRST